MSIWTDDPEIRCGHCTKRFSIMASFEFRPDAETECPNCGASLVFKDEELLRRWSWGVKRAPLDKGEGVKGGNT